MSEAEDVSELLFFDTFSHESDAVSDNTATNLVKDENIC